MADEVHSDQLPNSYGDGWIEAMDWVEDLIDEMLSDKTFDKKTLKELQDRISNA